MEGREKRLVIHGLGRKEEADGMRACPKQNEPDNQPKLQISMKVERVRRRAYGRDQLALGGTKNCL